MAEAYVLTAGDYSDYRIVGVFSTREAAEEAKARRCEPDDNDIEEFELDDPAVLGAEPEAGFERGPIYLACIYIADGRIEGCRDTPHVAEGYRHPARCRITEYSSDLGGGRYDCVRVYSPVSYQHAEKVAIEKRQEWLRTREVACPTPEGGASRP